MKDTVTEGSADASKRSKIDTLIALPRTTKHILAIATDAALCVLTVWLAICFRFESWVSLRDYQWLAVVLSIALAIPLLSIFGFYHTVIRFAGKQTILAAVRAVAVYSVLYSAIFTVYGFPLVPRTIGLLQPLLLLISIGIVRLLVSELLAEHIPSKKELSKLPAAVIYGAGNSGQQLAASISAHGQTHVVGFIDDNPNLHNTKIAGLPVYPPSFLNRLIEKHRVRDVLLAMPRLSRSRRNEIIKLLKNCKVAVRTLPSLSDLAIGKITESDLRNLDIEDLLGRDPVSPIPQLLSKNIAGKTVLVTGAGGSIGSELCRQICKLSPQHLILVELNEFALFTIKEELEPLTKTSGFKLTALLANILDKEHISRIVDQFRPHTIYHAAAYKHVPLVESNPLAGLRNNILGTLNLAQAALGANVNVMVLISTDKAVRPSSIMGASKRLAEIVLQAIAAQNKHQETATCFCIVRFGNVLASSGSVVPKFREQIKKGEPITVTHPNVTRYFMTTPEAAQLVIQASGMNVNHQQGALVYLLDMGESVRIVDLAKTMIQLSGMRVRDEANPDGDIEIKYIGLREGEKLHEELLISGQFNQTEHPKIMVSLHEEPANFLQVLEFIDSLRSIELETRSIQKALTQLNIGYISPV